MPVLVKDLKVGDKVRFDEDRYEFKAGKEYVVDHVVGSCRVRFAGHYLSCTDGDTLLRCSKVEGPRLLKREFEDPKPVAPVLKSSTLHCHIDEDDHLEVRLGSDNECVAFEAVSTTDSPLYVEDPLVLRAFIDDLTALHGRMVEKLGSETLAGAK